MCEKGMLRIFRFEPGSIPEIQAEIDIEFLRISLQVEL